jgi:dienelactone hydrolase
LKTQRGFLFTLLIVAPLLTTTAAPNTNNAPADTSRESVESGKKFVYKQSGGNPQELEVYFPAEWDAAKSKVPGVILFHGGAWIAGTLDQFRYACKYLASRGLVAATANYRMLTTAEAKALPAGESIKRTCITDAKSAIRWMKQHAAELGIDPQRIVAGGGSAGGHIAVLATTNPGLNDPGDPKEFDVSVAAYLLFNPAFQPQDESDPEVLLQKISRPIWLPPFSSSVKTTTRSNPAERPCSGSSRRLVTQIANSGSPKGRATGSSTSPRGRM